MKSFLFAMLLAPSFAMAADILVINHENSDEVMQGAFNPTTGNVVDFSVSDYASHFGDTDRITTQGDFDFVYEPWTVTLRNVGDNGDEDVTFTYHCWPGFHVGALILYCAD